MPSLQAILALFGALLIAGAFLSGLAQRSFLSLAAVFVLAGFAAGDGGFGWISFHAQSGFVRDLATVALVVILFRDGLEVEAEMLQRAWHVPLRKLVVGMPITMGLVAVAAHALVHLPWTQALLLGALVSPTDPVLTSSIVTNPRVPRMVRHSLNLESGLNDGLALPVVVALLADLEGGSGHFVLWRFLLRDVGLGLLCGLALGYVASLLLPSVSPDSPIHPIPAHQKSLYALGVAVATYGVTVLGPHGNGFIAVFVAAIVLGLRSPGVREHFEQRADEIVEIVKLGIFVVFGSLLTLDALASSGWASLALVALAFVVVRPLAVWVSLAGSSIDAPTRLFMGWFGPKGIATMTFALIVLDQQVAHAQRIFDLAALFVFCSIIVHGLSDTPGANWIARRSQRTEEQPVHA